MKKKSIVVSVAGLLSVSLLGVTPVAAAAAKGTPPKPVVVLVKTTSQGKNLLKITIMIEKQSASKVKIIDTKVFAAGTSCVIRASAKSCSISRVNSLRYGRFLGISAQARNVKGYGPRSSTIRLINATKWIRTGYDPNGVKFPSLVVSTNKSRLLGLTTKWSKFQALKRKSVNAAGLRQARVSTTDGTSVVFQVGGVVGLAQSASNSTCSTNQPYSSCTFGVGIEGTSVSLFAAGSATPAVRDFYSAPNNKFYVVFSTPTQLVSDGARCVLAEVNTDTGAPTCVDSEITSVTMGLGYMFGPAGNGNAPIQFDDAGNIYYTGQVTGFSFTLRKNVNGVITPLVRDNVVVRDFLVLGDGSVIMSGYTQSTQAWWIRKVSAGSGAITNLANGTQATFLRKFVDKNIYYGVPNTIGVTGGVFRYSIDQGKTDELPWMSNIYASSSATKSQTDMSSVCFGINDSFCVGSGVYVREVFNIGTDRTMAISGMQGVSGTTELMQYYPTVARANTVISSITVWLQVGKKLLLAGTDKSGKNLLSLYDPETFQETLLLDASNEVEIYHLGYVASANKVMFNGLSFANGQPVVGDIPL